MLDSKINSLLHYILVGPILVLMCHDIVHEVTLHVGFDEAIRYETKFMFCQMSKTIILNNILKIKTQIVERL